MITNKNIHPLFIRSFTLFIYLVTRAFNKCLQSSYYSYKAHYPVIFEDFHALSYIKLKQEN